MWKRVLKFMYVLTLIGSVYSYVNNGNSYNSQNSKESYVNHHLARFRHQMSTVRPRTLSNSYHRNHQNHHRLFTTEPTIRYNPMHDHHKFRHTKYSNIDSLLTKISRLESENKEPARNKQRWALTESPLRYTTAATTAKSAKDTYDDDLFEDNYDENDEDSADFDEDDTVANPARLKKLEDIHDGVTADWFQANDDEEDDDGDDDSGWQAEEATTTMPSLTDYKWKHYGTRDRVANTRRRMGSDSNNLNEMDAAVQHAVRINREAGCKVPKARVVSIQQVYPDSSKTYIPHCTVLHQCGDDAGCCRAEALTCAPKYTTRVELYFYTTSGIDMGQSISKVEKLAFYNHTDCECINKRDVNSHQQNSKSRHHLRPGFALRAAPHPSQQPAPQTIVRCKCPELYSSHSVHSGHCKCDCGIGNRDCVKLRRGNEHFSLKDRLCIRNAQCGFPTCEFGSYLKYLGRCPKKQEKFDHFSQGRI